MDYHSLFLTGSFSSSPPRKTKSEKQKEVPLQLLKMPPNHHQPKISNEDLFQDLHPLPSDRKRPFEQGQSVPKDSVPRVTSPSISVDYEEEALKFKESFFLPKSETPTSTVREAWLKLSKEKDLSKYQVKNLPQEEYIFNIQEPEPTPEETDDRLVFI